MATINITIKDDDRPDGNIDFNLESDPPLSPRKRATQTPAQCLAMEIIEFLSQVSQSVKVESVNGR